MAQKTDIVLEAFAPSPDSYDADELEYQNLRRAFKNYSFPAFFKRSSIKLFQPHTSLTLPELKQDFKVAAIINASYRLQKSLTPIDKYVWSKVFTRSSVQLFGEPKNKEIAKLASSELAIFEGIAADVQKNDFAQPLLVAYSTLCSGKRKQTVALQVKYRELMQEIHDIFEKEYSEVFACFDGYPSTQAFAPKDVVVVFDAALKCLEKKDVAWKDWKVVLQNSAHLSVNARRKKIIVGKHRAPVDHACIRGLFAHEVLVHAQRALNGSKISKKLASGTPDYLVAEEGLGVLIEASINGVIPEKIKDRYIDIALALGGPKRPALSREDLFSVCYRRAVLRSIAAQEEADMNALEKASWEHVNRIYRGSLGNNYVGVFTKDIAYYRGFIKLARHFDKSRKKGMLESQLRFTLQGKFDPTM